MTGDGCVPKGRAWQSVLLVRPVDSKGDVMSVGDMIGYGDVIGEIEHFVACPVIRVGCNQMVVSNALDWDIVPKDVWGEVERDICRLVMGERLDDPQGDVRDVMRRIKALADAK